jgi:hypothetical protein
MGYNGSYGVSAFSGCNNIKKIIWNAKNCTTYENSYQRGCQEPFGSSASMVEEVIFGDNVRNIGQNLCKGFSKVTKLTFPGTLVSVGTDAFSGCSSIQSVTSKNRYPGDISEISKIPSASPSATLIVPHNSAILYGERVGWKNFSNIIEFEDPKIYLTLKFPESGTITHKEIYEEAVDLSFKANEGWEINSITFNEEDVTAELDEDGNYTTPVLTADAILVVVFEKIDTSVEPISEKNNIKVYAYNGEVRIVGAEPQSEVSIYNSIGALVYKGNDKTIVLNGNGVYILTVEGRTFKFAM